MEAPNPPSRLPASTHVPTASAASMPPSAGNKRAFQSTKSRAQTTEEAQAHAPTTAIEGRSAESPNYIVIKARKEPKFLTEEGYATPLGERYIPDAMWNHPTAITRKPSQPYCWSIEATLNLEANIRRALAEGQVAGKPAIIELGVFTNFGACYAAVAGPVVTDSNDKAQMEAWLEHRKTWPTVKLLYEGSSERIHAQKAENKSGTLKEANTSYPGQYMGVLLKSDYPNLTQDVVFVADTPQEVANCLHDTIIRFQGFTKPGDS